MSAPTDDPQAPDKAQPPVLKVISSDATPEEIAAIVAVFAAIGGATKPPPRRTPEWQANHRKMRLTLPNGPGGWRSSGLPR